MAFPVYTFPFKLFIVQPSSSLSFIKATIYYSIFKFLDLISYLFHSQPNNVQENQTGKPINPPQSAVLIRELLPVIKFSEEGNQWQEICPVCLCEFESGGDDEMITCLINCEHVFHKRCLDQWLDYDHETCPVCRKHLVPRELMKEFKDRLWYGFVNGEDIYCG